MKVGVMDSESISFYTCRNQINIIVCHLTDDFLLKVAPNDIVTITRLDAEAFYASNVCMKSVVLWDPSVTVNLNNEEITVPIIRTYEKIPMNDLCFKPFENPTTDDIISFTKKEIPSSDVIMFMVSAKSLFRIAENSEMGWIEYFFGLIGYPKVLPRVEQIAKLSSLYNVARTSNMNRLQNDVWLLVTDLEYFNGCITRDLWIKHCGEMHSCRVVFHSSTSHKSVSMMMKTIISRNLGEQDESQSYRIVFEKR